MAIDSRPKSRPRKIQSECATPKCHRESGHGVTGRFCAECAARLAGVGVRLKNESHAIQRHGLDPSAKRKDSGPKPKRSPTCCRIGCFEPRVPPNSFCELCVQAGYVQDD